MKALLRFALGTLLVMLVAGIAVALLVVQHAPIVPQESTISVRDVARARQLLHAHDPRRASDGSVRTAVLTDQDVTLLTQYAASRWRRAVTRVTLRDGASDVHVSMALPDNPVGRWLNLDVTLVQAAGLPRVRHLRVGHLPVPSFAADVIARWLLSRVEAGVPLALAEDMVRTVAFTPASVRVEYAWRAGATSRVRDLLVAPEDLARLEASNATLVSIVSSLPAGRTVSLTAVLVPLMQAASQRAAGGDSVAEHRAALATLALYAVDRNLGRWMRVASSWPKPKQRTVTLGGRADLARHFLVSAVVAAQAGSNLADAVGQLKEVEDSRGGTGYSFADIAADRAGTRFGERAVQSPSALASQLITGLQERSIMPDVAGLPEFMTDAQFTARYDSVGAPRHAAMMRVIEQRIAALPVYR